MGKETIQVIIGKRIAVCRKEKGIKQAELAKKLGKSVKTVQRYESGDIDLSLSLLEKISNVLEVPINYLIDYTSNMDFESVSDVTKKEYHQKAMCFYEAIVSLYREEDDRGDIDVIPQLSLSSENLAEDLYAMFLAIMLFHQRITENDDIDVLDFISILNHLAFQYSKSENTESGAKMDGKEQE